MFRIVYYFWINLTDNEINKTKKDIYIHHRHVIFPSTLFKSIVLVEIMKREIHGNTQQQKQKYIAKELFALPNVLSRCPKGIRKC